MGISRTTVFAGTVIALALGLLAAWFRLNQDGYCFPERRYLTENELIDSAVNDLIARTAPADSASGFVDGKFVKVPDLREHNVRYASASDFRAKAPECCEVLRREQYPDYEIPWLRKATGGFVAMVQVSFVHGAYAKDRSVVQRLQSHRVPITNCGSVRNDS